MITLQYRRPDGSFVATVNGMPYHVTADNPRFAEAQAEADVLGVTLPFEPELPAPDPVPPTSQPPAIKACALRNSASGGVVSSVGGSFNIAGMIQMDVGTFWVFLTDPITGAQPEVVPNNGIHVAITGWSETDFFIETRDHAGGTLIDPPSFGFTLYQF